MVEDKGFTCKEDAVASEKVNIDKKVTKYSEFLKLKQSKHNSNTNSGSGSKIINNSIKPREPQIKECNITRHPILNSEQHSLLPSTLNITNLNANDIFNYIDSLEKSTNLLNFKHSRK